MAKGSCFFTLRFPARADQLKKMREAVRRAAAQEECATDMVDSIILAVNEACMNIIQHGYRQEGAGEIILEIFHDQDELTIRITDFADPVDPARCRPRKLDEIRPGGLGTHFMNELMDEIHYLKSPSGIGNILEMKKRFVK